MNESVYNAKGTKTSSQIYKTEKVGDSVYSGCTSSKDGKGNVIFTGKTSDGMSGDGKKKLVASYIDSKGSSGSTTAKSTTQSSISTTGKSVLGSYTFTSSTGSESASSFELLKETLSSSGGTSGSSIMKVSMGTWLCWGSCWH